MLDFLKQLIRYKKVDLEAKLRPTPDCTFGGVGEVEVEVWSDGTASVEASVKKTGLPDGADIEVYCAGTRLTSLRVVGGFAKHVMTYGERQAPPQIKAGDQADFRVDGSVLYRGSFRRD